MFLEDFEHSACSKYLQNYKTKLPLKIFLRENILKLKVTMKQIIRKTVLGISSDCRSVF